ncbi:hypothetical protein NLM24_26430 [Nocardia zapadnayensis]|uniref:hypothetical protein n=1 Tax=Nocardia rhamnosiphila TaxID=426716 RepID=UPI002245E3A1|nr:hypothetical protein [Nocardia zapadnayensis]MCX0274163.1 hypothetical protein [Nocardia zapadnayensis]
MVIRERPGAAAVDTAPIYGEPFETADGAIVITVSRRGSFPGSPMRPAGIFVVRDSAATWVPAVDVNRIALLGEWIGLLAAVIAALAVLRRPPWPDLSYRRTN